MTSIESLAPAPSELRIRGRNIMAVVLAPAYPVTAWFAALDRRMGEMPELLAGRPIVADLTGVTDAGPEAPLIVLDGLEARGLKLVGVEGAGHARLAGTRWNALTRLTQGRDVALQAAPPQPAPPPAEPPKPALLIDHPVRSGQSVVFEDGDLTVVGAVASGAEVVAGGSIHVYGALRGRAIAGLSTGAAARIFCSRLEAEMVGIDRLCRTAESWDASLHGQAAQIRCHRGAIEIAPLP